MIFYIQSNQVSTPSIPEKDLVRVTHTQIYPVVTVLSLTRPFHCFQHNCSLFFTKLSHLLMSRTPCACNWVPALLAASSQSPSLVLFSSSTTKCPGLSRWHFFKPMALNRTCPLSLPHLYLKIQTCPRTPESYTQHPAGYLSTGFLKSILKLTQPK